MSSFVHHAHQPVLSLDATTVTVPVTAMNQFRWQNALLLVDPEVLCDFEFLSSDSSENENYAIQLQGVLRPFVEGGLIEKQELISKNHKSLNLSLAVRWIMEINFCREPIAKVNLWNFIETFSA